MTRPYLHAPLPRFVRRLLKAPRIFLGLIYTPWSIASRETMMADLLTMIEQLRDLSAELERARTETELLRAENAALRLRLSEIQAAALADTAAIAGHVA